MVFLLKMNDESTGSATNDVDMVRRNKWHFKEI